MENNILDGPVMPSEGAAYRDSTYELVSKVAYLLGVPKRIFDNEHEPPKLDVYERLEKDKNTRIISQTSRGVSEVTIKNYHNHLKSISHHIDIEMPMDALTKRHLKQKRTLVV